MKSLALHLVFMFVGAFGEGSPFDRDSCVHFKPKIFPDIELDGKSPLVIELDPKTVKAGQPITSKYVGKKTDGPTKSLINFALQKKT